jgi:hypothetical protein
MPADQARVLDRVTEILNLCAPGTYSSTISPRNKTRNEAAIADFTTEAGLELLQMLAETPNEYRHNFVVETTPAYMEFLPDHQGQPAYVYIRPYSGAEFIPGQQKDYQSIASYRQNPSKVYDERGHDANGSTLSGYYDIWERKFYFTGYEAKVGLAQVARADVATKVPEILEPVWVKLAVGKAAKSGLGAYDAQVVDRYGTEAKQDMAEFKQGRRIFAEASEPDNSAEVHQR